MPRAHDIVVGGTDEEGEWSRTPSPDAAAAILARARRLVPGARAGPGAAAPGRPASRPPVGRRASGWASVVHCYGHGGAGVTLSWGTADEVAELVSANPN